MADNSDPRSKLAAYNTQQSEGNASPEFCAFYDMPPHEKEALANHWYIRGQNFVLVFTEAQPGAILSRLGQVDEYSVLLEHSSTNAHITWGDEAIDVDGHSLIMVPPGDSVVTLPNGGRVTRLFTSKSEDLVGKCPNAASYTERKPNVAPYEPWPEPVSGWKLRPYSLDVPIPEGSFARMYRNTNFMINVFDIFTGPRDPKRMSPHSHDDFEQCSLALEGEWVHSLRWEWGADSTDWREDEHIRCGAPSALVIPASTIHASRWVSDERNRLVDIFSPPRVDFSKMENWILNADEYPMPEGV